jgi:NTE family protein
VFEFLPRRGRNGTGAHPIIDDDGSAGAAVTETVDPASEAPIGESSIKQAPIGEAPIVRPVGPTLGLALGGGAARGFAHLGVLRTLLAKGLRFDVIAGTSIGAVVGGTYAAGQLASFEDWACSLTRRRMFGYLDFSLGGSGLIGGARLADRLQETLGKATIDELPMRFAAIATEIGTGHEIWLTRGRLADALRASYALPGVFSPVRVGGRWLMDGALVNPVPVSACRALGARVVIAVNLNADLIGRGSTIASHGSDEADETMLELVQQHNGLRAMFGAERAMKRQFLGAGGRPGFSTVMMEAFNIMQDRITRARLAGDPPDVSINPRLGGVGLIDFHRAADAIAIGAEATERALDDIGEVIAALK